MVVARPTTDLPRKFTDRWNLITAQDFAKAAEKAIILAAREVVEHAISDTAFGILRTDPKLSVRIQIPVDEAAWWDVDFSEVLDEWISDRAQGGKLLDAEYREEASRISAALREALNKISDALDS